MSIPNVSIIMPIYNAADFLHESLGGLLKQTLTDIEIICVNDGSTDNSLDIIKEYAYNDSRIKIINKSNSGYGNTMNLGLKMATGEYIGILEPDDFADTEMFEKLYLTAKKFNVDVVKANYFEYSQKNNSNTFYEVLYGHEYNKIVSADENEFIVFLRPCIWTAIYRRQFLMDIILHLMKHLVRRIRTQLLRLKFGCPILKLFFLKRLIYIIESIMIIHL